MVLSTYIEGEKNNINDSVSLLNSKESDSSEIQKIKEHLDISNIKYMSLNIQSYSGRR